MSETAKGNVTIFYSWQSDHRDTKNFIEKALKAAIKEVAKDVSFEQSPRLDKDTKGSVGSVNIIDTIIKKIDVCGIFVADVSIIGEIGDKKQVNQNMMFELGYAIARRTETNTLLLFNKDLGDINDLPFDIKVKRVMTFSISDDVTGVKLKNELAGALRVHMNHLEQQEVDQVTQELDEIELLIMRVFAAMETDRRIMTSVHLGGVDIILMDTIDKVLHDELRALDSQEVVANLEAMVEQGLLSLKHGSKGTPNFRPAKAGYHIINALNKSKPDNMKGEDS